MEQGKRSAALRTFPVMPHFFSHLRHMWHGICNIYLLFSRCTCRSHADVAPYSHTAMPMPLQCTTLPHRYSAATLVHCAARIRHTATLVHCHADVLSSLPLESDVPRACLLCSHADGALHCTARMPHCTLPRTAYQAHSPSSVPKVYVR